MSWLELSSTIMVAVFGSSGLWAFIASRRRKDDATTTMIKGLAYNAILSEARFMMDRGYATLEEYRDVYLYLYEPYKTLGGNGAAERVMQELGRLPMKGNSHALLHSERQSLPDH